MVRWSFGSLDRYEVRKTFFGVVLRAVPSDETIAAQCAAFDPDNRSAFVQVDVAVFDFSADADYCVAHLLSTQSRLNISTAVL